ncbi:heavy metal translocating P-type ATPase [Thiorhodospira sibirica]|uniref:heavy metal translocating P-type ATPase n=1 Tax=Thiorhodospira sibirica TaxID=154347 RepID=UPI00022C39B7|nr:heavy metal translocating P-type ATPase [Thiorhodospira sibirica]
MHSSCFHCGLPNPSGAPYQAVILGELRTFCCPGCQAVAQAIAAGGLEAYYRQRSASAQAVPVPSAEQQQRLALYDHPTLHARFVISQPDGTQETALLLEGIVCPACIWLNERHIGALPGVLEFSINYTTHRARVRWDPQHIRLSEILAAIQQIGYQAHPYDTERRQAAFERERNAQLRRLAVAGLGTMQVMMLAVALWFGANDPTQGEIMQFLRYTALVITTPVVFYAGSIFFHNAWRDLQARRVGMDVPIALAIGSTYLASAWATLAAHGEHVYFESVSMFVFFVLLSRYLEMMARQQAAQASEALGKAVPAMALRIQAGEECWVGVAELRVGDQLRIRPGDPIPVDGRVLEGDSAVNEAILTGESLPRRRRPGDALIGGSINMSSPLVMEVTHVGQDTVLSAMLRLLDRAQSEKPHLAQWAQRGTGYFVSAVLLLTAVVGLIWFLWIDPTRAFWVMVAMLVVSCPCALALATPVAITAAVERLAKQGVLVTRGHALETLAQVQQIIFDKTGTLTTGQLQLQYGHYFDPAHTEPYCHALAKALEHGSEHPVAQVFQALSPEITIRLDDQQRAVTGAGIEGRLNGQAIRIGSPAFVLELAPRSPALIRQLHEYAQQYPAATPVLLGNRQQVLALFGLSDTLRSDAGQAIRQLQAHGLAVRILSGDSHAATQAIAQRLQIAQAQGECTPEDKVRALQAAQTQGHIVAMVGDGINDAPVLSQAHVAIAMTSGAHLAQNNADMLLCSQQLSALPQAVHKARQTLRIVRQNITWAIGYNLIAIPIAATGLLTPWLAALGMSASSLLVVLNALRLRK